MILIAVIPKIGHECLVADGTFIFSYKSTWVKQGSVYITGCLLASTLGTSQTSTDHIPALSHRRISAQLLAKLHYSTAVYPKGSRVYSCDTAVYWLIIYHPGLRISTQQ